MQTLVHRCAALHMSSTSAPAATRLRWDRRAPWTSATGRHTSLEQITDYRLHHGEAVAIGLALDVTYSYLQGWLTLRATGGAFCKHPVRPRLCPVRTGDGDGADELFHGLREFREHLGGELTIQMLQSLGTGFNVHEIDETRDGPCC